MAYVEFNSKDLQPHLPEMTDVESNVKELIAPKLEMVDEESNLKGLKTSKNKRMDCGFRRTFCILFSVILFILVLLAAVIVVLYLILKPKAPEVTLSSMDVTSLDLRSGNASLTSLSMPAANISALDDDDFNLSSNITLYLDIHNPNKVDVSFKVLKVFAYYSTSFSIGKTRVSPFKQEKGSLVNLNTEFVEKNLPMSPELGFEFLHAYSNNSIPLKFVIAASASIKIWGFATPDATVTVGCTLRYKPLYNQISNKACSVRKVRVG